MLERLSICYSGVILDVTNRDVTGRVERDAAGRGGTWRDGYKWAEFVGEYPHDFISLDINSYTKIIHHLLHSFLLYIVLRFFA